MTIVVYPAPVMANAQPIVVSPAPASLSAPTAVVVNAQPAVTVAPPPTGRAILYEYPNFGGARAIVDRGQAKDLDWANFNYVIVQCRYASSQAPGCSARR